MEKDKFDQLVQAERMRQDNKWGEQNHTHEKWAVILGEEFGEFCRASCEFNYEGMEKELIQVAAVAKVMWESGKRNGWL